MKTKRTILIKTHYHHHLGPISMVHSSPHATDRSSNVKIMLCADIKASHLRKHICLQPPVFLLMLTISAFRKWGNCHKCITFRHLKCTLDVHQPPHLHSESFYQCHLIPKKQKVAAALKVFVVLEWMGTDTSTFEM